MTGSFFMSKIAYANELDLPVAGQMLAVSNNVSSPTLKGLKLDLENPLNIEFIVDMNDKKEITKAKSMTLIKYFFAALTTPKEDVWVNLSPYEKNRIVDKKFGQTDMGKDLLAQDYILKQLAASLTNPKLDTGKAYWNNNAKTDVLDKIWIVPGEVELVEYDNYVAIKSSSLDVKFKGLAESGASNMSAIIGTIKEDVNNGENFANLRQIYSALILGLWFKDKLKDSFYKNYFNQSKVNSIAIDDIEAKDKIFKQYCKAFEKGAYNIIQKEHDANNRLEKRKYFAGGFEIVDFTSSAVVAKELETFDKAFDKMDRYKIIASNISSYSNGLTAKDLSQRIKELGVYIGDDWNDFTFPKTLGTFKTAFMYKDVFFRIYNKIHTYGWMKDAGTTEAELSELIDNDLLCAKIFNLPGLAVDVIERVIPYDELLTRAKEVGDVEFIDKLHQSRMSNPLIRNGFIDENSEINSGFALRYDEKGKALLTPVIFDLGQMFYEKKQYQNKTVISEFIEIELGEWPLVTLDYEYVKKYIHERHDISKSQVSFNDMKSKVSKLVDLQEQKVNNNVNGGADFSELNVSSAGTSKIEFKTNQNFDFNNFEIKIRSIKEFSIN